VEVTQIPTEKVKKKIILFLNVSTDSDLKLADIVVHVKDGIRNYNKLSIIYYQ